MRTFKEWWSNLPQNIKEDISIVNEKPLLNQVNYVWLSNVMNNYSEEFNPTTEELIEWIVSEQIDARRK